MILPTKRLSENRALLTVGGRILGLLSEPKTVSRLWAELRHSYNGGTGPSLLTFDWFILALDLLYALNTIELDDGHIKRVKR